MCGSRGKGHGVRNPLGTHKAIGFLSTTGQDLLKQITKLPSQYSMMCHHRSASETPLNDIAFRWRANVATLLVVTRPSLPSSTKITIKITMSELSWTPSDKPFWISARGLTLMPLLCICCVHTSSKCSDKAVGIYRFG